MLLEEGRHLFGQYSIGIRKAAGHIIDEHALIQYALHEIRLSQVVALVGDIEGAPQEGVAWHERHERDPSDAKNTVQFSGGTIRSFGSGRW